MVALGLGFVIFIHELGHFALAKWADVKVDKFSIGFGPTLVGFQWGETYYSLSIIPLGGFVKMLGENPTEDGQEAQSDPRSYLNKTVGARMGIISAGVIMNLITGFFFFFFAYRFGLPLFRVRQLIRRVFNPVMKLRRWMVKPESLSKTFSKRSVSQGMVNRCVWT
jgi:regulator of sigma E protease